MPSPLDRPPIQGVDAIDQEKVSREKTIAESAARASNSTDFY
jgi:hypothetical protein